MSTFARSEIPSRATIRPSTRKEVSPNHPGHSTKGRSAGISARPPMSSAASRVFDAKLARGKPLKVPRQLHGRDSTPLTSNGLMRPGRQRHQPRARLFPEPTTSSCSTRCTTRWSRHDQARVSPFARQHGQKREPLHALLLRNQAGEEVGVDLRASRRLSSSSSRESTLHLQVGDHTQRAGVVTERHLGWQLRLLPLPVDPDREARFAARVALLRAAAPPQPAPPRLTSPSRAIGRPEKNSRLRRGPPLAPTHAVPPVRPFQPPTDWTLPPPPALRQRARLRHR